MNMYFGKHLKMGISLDILTFTFSGLRTFKSDCSVQLGRIVCFEVFMFMWI